MDPCEVVVAGHICLDLTPKFLETGAKSLSQIIVPGALTTVGECVAATGGLVANTGLALTRMGIRTMLMGKVGEDSFGRAITEILDGYGCAGGIVRAPGEATSYTIVIAPPGIDRAFLHNPGANRTFGAEDVDYAALDSAGIFHLGYPPLLERLFANGGAELAAIFERARGRGVTTSLDMSLPDPESPSGRADWDAVLRRTLPNVDLFLPSIEEVLYLLEREEFMRRRHEAAERGCGIIDLLRPRDYGRLSGRLLDYGAGVVALKSGHRGIYVRTAGRDRLAAFGRTRAADPDNWAERELWQPPYRVEQVVSATGSGDCAAAGFLAAFVRGRSIERTLQYATAAGAQNVMVHDAVSGIRSYEQTTELLDRMPRGELTIRAEGWKREPEGLWRGPADGRGEDGHGEHEHEHE
jgi:sugar/nucleoside kinase (ribokinase family)